MRVQLAHATKAGGLALELQVHHGVAGVVRLQQLFHVFQTVGMQHLVAPALE
ncbi:hypothetical protein SDC9_115788 [bioreactor metagenome]|uniref:Uncharacterized protein n=1 Tax=bioreactor metagenome TaxID=1076179 RepID=A0A645C0J8_9ZZZZ